MLTTTPRYPILPELTQPIINQQVWEDFDSKKTFLLKTKMTRCADKYFELKRPKKDSLSPIDSIM